MTIFTLAFICFTGAGLSASVIMLMMKWLIIQRYKELRATNKYFAMLPPPCMFCIGFWLCVAWVVYVITSGLVAWHPVYIAAPFASAAFTYKIIQ